MNASKQQESEQPKIPRRPWLLSEQYGLEFILSQDNEILVGSDACKSIPIELRKFIVEAVNNYKLTPATPSGDEEIETPRFDEFIVRETTGNHRKDFDALSAFAKKLERELLSHANEREEDRSQLAHFQSRIVEVTNAYRATLAAREGEIKALREEAEVLRKVEYDESWVRQCQYNEQLESQLSALQAELATAQREIEELRGQRDRLEGRAEQLSKRVLKWQEFGVPKAIELRELKMQLSTLRANRDEWMNAATEAKRAYDEANAKLAEAAKLIGDAISYAEMPFEAKDCMRRFLTRLSP